MSAMLASAEVANPAAPSALEASKASQRHHAGVGSPEPRHAMSLTGLISNRLSYPRAGSHLELLHFIFMPNEGLPRPRAPYVCDGMNQQEALTLSCSIFMPIERCSLPLSASLKLSRSALYFPRASATAVCAVFRPSSKYTVSLSCRTLVLCTQIPWNLHTSPNAIGGDLTESTLERCSVRFASVGDLRLIQR